MDPPALSKNLVLSASPSHTQLIKEVDEVKADVTQNMIKMNDKLDAGLELVEKLVSSAGQHAFYFAANHPPGLHLSLVLPPVCIVSNLLI